MKTQKELREMVNELVEVMKEGMLSWEIELIEFLQQQQDSAFTSKQIKTIEKLWDTVRP